MTIAFTGLLGFGGADMLDRFLASHPLDTTTGKIMDTANGTRYPGMMNGAAISAPMDVTRWAAGLGGMTALPIIIGGFVRAPMWRAVFQGFGIGAGLRTLGKGFSDLIAMMFKPTASNAHATFQRLYVNEMRGAALKSGDTAEQAMIVSTGLGAASRPAGYPGTLGAPCGPGCHCAKCGTLGAPPQQQHTHAPTAQNPFPGRQMPAALPQGNPNLGATRSRYSFAVDPIRSGWRSNRAG